MAPFPRYKQRSVANKTLSKAIQRALAPVGMPHSLSWEGSSRLSAGTESSPEHGPGVALLSRGRR